MRHRYTLPLAVLLALLVGASPVLAQQATSIAEARTLPAGQEATVTGVLATPDYGFNEGASPFAVGDDLILTGEIGVFEGQNQLVVDEEGAIEIVQRGQPLPQPAEITLQQFTADSPLQGQRVWLSGELVLPVDAPWPDDPIAAGSGLTTFFVDDAGMGTDTLFVRIDRGESFFDGTMRPEGLSAVLNQAAGVLSRFGDQAQLLPFFEDDLVFFSLSTDDEDTRAFAVESLAPNPTAGDAALRLPEATAVHAKVYNALGRRVLTLPLGRMQVGAAEVPLSSDAAGVYHVRITADAPIEQHTTHASLTLVR